MKAILLVRVSTERQNFDEQEKELFNLALRDGYKENDIISIAFKESAIKLSEEERAGLNMMKELIESDSTIDCVYAWEISRIARKKKILFSILDYLINRKIQLVIKEPYLKLLNEDKTINESAEISFTLFAQMAESEMRNKQVRFKRAKNEMRKNGRYVGGRILFGYKLKNEDSNEIVINEEEANEVKFIFEEYSKGEHSTNSLSKLCALKGFKLCKLHNIRTILNNRSYAKNREDKIQYPAIISKELFDKCEIIRNTNNKSFGLKQKNIYLCTKLIRCKICKYRYNAVKHNNQYMCAGRVSYISHKIDVKDKCKSPNISIALLDALIWSYCANSEAFAPTQLTQESDDLNIQIKQLNNELENARSIIDNIDKLKRKKNIQYDNDAISEEDYLKEIKKINKERIEIENTINNINEKIEDLKSIQIFKNSYSERKKNILNIKNNEERRKIIRSIIKEITIENTDNVYHKIVRIETNHNNKNMFLVNCAINTTKSYAKIFHPNTYYDKEMKRFVVYVGDSYKCDYTFEEAFSKNALYSRVIEFEREVYFINENKKKATATRAKNLSIEEKEIRNRKARERYKLWKEHKKKEGGK